MPVIFTGRSAKEGGLTEGNGSFPAPAHRADPASPSVSVGNGEERQEGLEGNGEEERMRQLPGNGTDVLNTFSLNSYYNTMSYSDVKIFR